MQHKAVSGGSANPQSSTSDALDMHSSGAFEDKSIADSLQIVGLDDDGLRASIDAWNGPEHLKSAMLALVDAGHAR